MNSRITFVLTFLMAIYLTNSLNAQSIASGFEAGDGSKGNPFQIANIEQLRYLAQECNNGNTFQDKYFIVTNDLRDNKSVLDENGNLVSDFETLRNWTAIGENKTTPFMGNINGQGHVFAGFYGSFEKDGVFKFAKNCTFENIIIKDSYFQSFVASELKLENVNFINCINYATTWYGISYGGRSNTDENVNFINCGNYGKCRVTGIAHSASRLLNCYNFGEIGDDTDVFRPSSLAYECCELLNCFNAGNVKSTNYHSPWGGLIWLLNNEKTVSGKRGTTKVDNCVNYGTYDSPESYYYDDMVYGIAYRNNPSGHLNSNLSNMFWLKNICDESFGQLYEPYTIVNSRAMNEDEMMTDAFINQLNSNAQNIEGACGWKKSRLGFPILNIIDENTNGVEPINIDVPDDYIIYYNMKGEKVSNPSSGLFIKYQKNEIKKIMIP